MAKRGTGTKGVQWGKVEKVSGDLNYMTGADDVKIRTEFVPVRAARGRRFYVPTSFVIIGARCW